MDENEKRRVDDKLNEIFTKIQILESNCNDCKVKIENLKYESEFIMYEMRKLKNQCKIYTNFEYIPLLKSE